MKSVFITGVSTGIGYAAINAFIKNGYHVFGSVRHEQDAIRLQAEFGEMFQAFVFDVTDEAAVYAAANKVRAQLQGEPLSGLINNAGIAVQGPLMLMPISEFRQQLEVNVTGQLIVTQAFLPLLKKGKIINMSSVSGTHAYPFMGAYATSKFALEGFSESLRRELLIDDIPVVVVAPGMIKTEIWEKVDREEMPKALLNSIYAMPAQKLKAYMLDRVRRYGLPVEEVASLLGAYYGNIAPKITVCHLKRSVFKMDIAQFTAKAMG